MNIKNSCGSSSAKDCVKSLGIVFGDIGTSPLYTITIIFYLIKPTEAHIFGILSLVFWTMITLVTIQYVWLAMSLSKEGEGGTIVLKEVILPLLKSGRSITGVMLVSFIGVSLLVGDGVITPAITILSAVEGISLIPGLSGVGLKTLLLIAAIIAIFLFVIQKHGTEKVGRSFGPVMLVWFAVLGISGLISILNYPGVFKAINPYYAMKFLLENGLMGFFILSEVLLCATGGEALYADMGHLGRKPITRAWYIVFVALVLNYFGQGVYILQNTNAKNILFEMVLSQARILYVPFLILSIAASIIASQAMISGMFSIVYQGIMTRIIPILKVDYTSREHSKQIYIGTVNWFLMIAVIFMLILFKQSNRLAVAYGMAVSGTMAITGILISGIFLLKKKRFLAIVAILITFVDTVFLLSNSYKFMHGGYWSIIIASLPLFLIILYTRGQKKLYSSLKPIPIANFLKEYQETYTKVYRIRGTALFLARDSREIPPYIYRTMIVNNIIYEDNILISIGKLSEPYGITVSKVEAVSTGLRFLHIETGYMELIDVEKLVRAAGIDEKAIFYGIDDINTERFLWKIFATIKKLTPSFVKFYKFPSDKLHGVVTRFDI